LGSLFGDAVKYIDCLFKLGDVDQAVLAFVIILYDMPKLAYSQILAQSQGYAWAPENFQISLTVR
jgi:hypothetical protein